MSAFFSSVCSTQAEQLKFFDGSNFSAGQIIPDSTVIKLERITRN